MLIGSAAAVAPTTVVAVLRVWHNFISSFFFLFVFFLLPKTPASSVFSLFCPANQFVTFDWASLLRCHAECDGTKQLYRIPYRTGSKMCKMRWKIQFNHSLVQSLWHVANGRREASE